MQFISKVLSLEKNDQTILFLFLMIVFNIIAAIVKFSFSIIIPSFWFGINAVFNIVLALMRIFSVRDYRKMRLEQDENEKEKIGIRNYLKNGVFLIGLGNIYLLASIYMYYLGVSSNMHEHMTYLTAFMAFSSIGSSLYGMIKYKRDNTPIIAGTKMVNFSNALTSIVLTQVVLLDKFSDGTDMNMKNGIAGIAVSIIIVALGFYMAVGTCKYIHNKQQGIINKK